MRANNQYCLRTLVILCLALGMAAPTAHGMKGLHLTSKESLLRRAKTGLKQLTASKHDHASESEITLRNFERCLSHVLLPLAGRITEVVPAGFSEAELWTLAGYTALSTVVGNVGDYFFRGVSLPTNFRGSPLMSFFRGAYGGVAISAIGLGIVLPAISQGFQVEPHVAAEIMGITSLVSGAARAAGKVIGNRMQAEQRWLPDTTRALEKE